MLLSHRRKLVRNFCISVVTLCISVVTLGSVITIQADDTYAADKVEQSSFLNERMFILEGELWGGYNTRDGNGLNSSGPPNTEIEDFPLIGGGFLAAFPLSENALAQIEFSAEQSLHKSDVGGVSADDTYSGSYSVGGHIAHNQEPYLIGLFGGFGGTNDTEGDQNSRNLFGGIEARFISQTGALSVQGGYLDNNAADLETIDNAFFARVVGQLFFSNGKTVVSADFSYVDGEQDADRPPANRDPMRILAWGVEVDRQVDWGIENANTSLFLAYQGIRVREDPTFFANVTGEETITDHTILGGIRFRFGAATPEDRVRNTAPRLPNVGRWTGAVPAVD